jgi:hypothetical protein
VKPTVEMVDSVPRVDSDNLYTVHGTVFLYIRQTNA